MERTEAFFDMMKGTALMALSTCVKDLPNVRIVTFGFDPKRPNTVFFTTFEGNQKIREFEQNPNVTLLPIAASPDFPVQVRIRGKVRRAEEGLDDVAALILQKDPSFAETLEAAREFLIPYQVDFDEASITIGMEDAQIIKV